MDLIPRIVCSRGKFESNALTTRPERQNVKHDFGVVQVERDMSSRDKRELRWGWESDENGDGEEARKWGWERNESEWNGMV
jgi:hypothetical protein